MGMRCKVAACAALVSIGVLSFGIYASGRSETLVPVRGKVFVAGKPADGAIVVLHPLSQSTAATEKSAARPAARVGPDGSFALGTFAPGDGAPAGDYRVAISWLETTRVGPAGKSRTRLKLPADFGAWDKTPLRATIGPGTTEIPAFELKN